jgi:putative phosphoesterase
MKVAALYDIHGNLPALDAVLREAREEGVDQIVVGGDVVLGPMPKECLDRVLALDIPTVFVKGNCDREVIARMSGLSAASALPQQVQESLTWVASQLSPKHRSAMDEWPSSVTLNVGALGKVLFCHATPQNDMDMFTKLTPEAKVLTLLGNTDATVIVCGHTHMQFDRKVGRYRVVNAGSVGMPFAEPGAYWLLLGDDLVCKRTEYDVMGAAGRIRDTRYPQAGEFASRNVLQPPAEADMLQRFTAA